MLRLTKYIAKTLSVRLSLMIVFSIAMLLMAVLFVMFHYSRKSVKEEALQKASQSLNGTVQHIDNILLSVEQAAGNMYWPLLQHLNQPERMHAYSRQLVESNPYIIGCAIALKPYYYKGQEYFMAYYHRVDISDPTSPIVQDDSYGNRPYTEQVWYTVPVEKGRPYWTDPLREEGKEDEPITSFCLPLYGAEGERVGVMTVDVSLHVLSDIILATKPSPNSYCTLLGRDGSYIVHPDSTKLHRQTVYDQLGPDSSPEAIVAAKEMMAGKTDYKTFNLGGQDYYVFYRPFERMAIQGRSMEELNWRVGIVYPQDDILGDTNRLLYNVLIIATIGLLLLLAMCLWFTRRQLKPLHLLTRSAQRIAEGHYDDPIPESKHHDEIGMLQNHFQSMQQSLAEHISELDQLTATLQEQGQVLSAAYEQAKEADRMKTAFLHNMTDQMLAPIDDIRQDVGILCGQLHDIDQQAVDQVVDDIQQKGKVVTVLLNHLLEVSEKAKNPETAHEETI